MIQLACLFAMLKKVKRSYPCFFCLRGELCWKARLTETSGNAFNFQILIVVNSAACFHQEMQLLRSHFYKAVPSGLTYKMMG